ncbi:MAG TPA: two-component regulator propeller domain-containing protein [Blastocatellia bacterium]|nr:two-component regulator propeller domain-containing protein [Blastocatellia bacterium]
MRHYDVSDGLAHSHVGAIHQDRKGYLWFGTWEGLSRFDGYRFKNYGVRDGLGHNIVNGIAEDRQGRLWVATNGGGVSRLIDDPREISSSHSSESALAASAAGVRRKFINFRVGDSVHSNQVNSLLFDAHDNLWLATDVGLYMAAAGQDHDLKFKEIVSRSGATYGMPAFADRRGRLWFGLTNELVEIVQGQIIKYGRDDGVGRQNVVGVVEDREGRLLVANERGVFEFIEPEDAGSRGRWRPFPLTLAPDQMVMTIEVDAGGALWVGTGKGLIKYRDGKQTLYTTAQGLSNNTIRALTEDRDENLWIGTEAGGVCKLSGELIVSVTRADGLPYQNVARVIEDRRGRIYAYIADGGLVEIVEGRAVPVPGGAPFISSIPYQDSRGVWWVNTFKGLYRFEGPDLKLFKGRKVSADDGIPADRINSAVTAADNRFGKLWIMYALDQSIYRLDLSRVGSATFERIPLNTTLPNLVLCMMSDRAGAIWLGGHEMLARLTDGKTDFFQPTEGLPETRPRSFFQDSRGWVWVGLRYKGVSVTKDPSAESPTFVNYSTETGLASDSVWAIAEDDMGRIYLGTGKGLDQLDPLTGQIRHFNTKDGLAGDMIHHCLKDRNGNIWVATTLGLSKFNPRAERTVDSPPPIYLSRAQVAGEDLPLAETGEQSISGFELPATRNNLLIEYVALSFHGEQRLRYQYKLEGPIGVGADWSPQAEGRSVNYASLAPGSYRFLARAVNQEGAVSPEPAVFQFRILPPLWQRWWFLALAMTMIGITGYVLYRYRVAQLLKLERMRTRIATDLHDDIGANLTRISILSEVAKQLQDKGANGDSPVSGSLQSIGEIARESVASMSDIVWAINPERDSLIDLTRKMRQHAEEVFTLRDIELKFTAPDASLDLNLDAHVRRDLYLVFKETVNNASRHSGCSIVEVELRIEGASLTLTIGDNGRGFDPAARTEGNGLLSMRRRSVALGGELFLESRVGAGARVRLTIPLARSWVGE